MKTRHSHLRAFCNNSIVLGEARCPICRAVMVPTVQNGQAIWLCLCNRKNDGIREWVNVGITRPDKPQEAPIPQRRRQIKLASNPARCSGVTRRITRF
jgi:ferredoxin-thioredoxin reductase catalytic subunit